MEIIKHALESGGISDKISGFQKISVKGKRISLSPDKNRVTFLYILSQTEEDSHEQQTYGRGFHIRRMTLHRFGIAWLSHIREYNPD